MYFVCILDNLFSSPTPLSPPINVIITCDEFYSFFLFVLKVKFDKRKKNLDFKIT